MFKMLVLLTLYLDSVYTYNGSDYYFRHPKSCIDLTTHKNYKLLPTKPNCGRTSQYSGIKNTVGFNVPIVETEFPWLVDIEVQVKEGTGPSCRHVTFDDLCDPKWIYRNSCSGSLINKRYVITAGRCVRLPFWERIAHHRKVIARLATIKRVNHGLDCEVEKCKPENRAINIEEVVIHSEFNDINQNDIALLRLAHPIEPIPTTFIRPICLPLSCSFQTRELECYDLTVAAWGGVRTGARKIRVEVTLELECDVAQRGLPQVTTSQLCAYGMPYEHTCSNDTGGPLMMEEFIRGRVRYNLIGIVSTGPHCVEDRRHKPPTVFVEVRYYLQWILDNIRP